MRLFIKDDEIDLILLVKLFWTERRIFIFCFVFCLIFGLIISFSIKNRYTATATLYPSTADESLNIGGLGSLAGMAGINLGSIMSDNSGIPSDLYPQVTHSVPFLTKLMNKRLTWKEEKDSISFFEKRIKDETYSLSNYLFDYTLGLPFTLKRLILPQEEKVECSQDSTFYSFTEDELSIIGELSDIISIKVDNKSGLVTLSVTLTEPLATAQLAVAAIDLLQQSIIDYKIQKSRDNFNFISERHNEARVLYENAQREFLEYKDVNRNVINERFNTNYQRLSDSYDISLIVYKNLVQQLEQAKISIKEKTPVFKVLEPVVMPLEKSYPKRTLLLFMSILLSFALSICIILGKLVIVNVKSKFL